MRKIFFSYSRKDEKLALKLANDLQQEGVDVWIDQLHIRPSEPWDEEIEKGLERANCLLVLLSSTSIASDNVLNEINFALEEKKQVLPIVIESGVRKPFNIRRIQHIDFTANYNDALEKLLRSLKLPIGDENKKPVETIEEPNGQWISNELTNPFDQNDRHVLRFEIEVLGNIVFGNLKKTAIDQSYSVSKALLDGKYMNSVLSFYTAEQSLLGSETISFKDFYYGQFKDGRLNFTMQSDRPWGFPGQKFTAGRG